MTEPTDWIDVLLRAGLVAVALSIAVVVMIAAPGVFWVLLILFAISVGLVLEWDTWMIRRSATRRSPGHEG